MYINTEPNSKTFKKEISSNSPNSNQAKLSSMIAEQVKNPFWVPNENNDLFILKEMLDDEKAINKAKKSDQPYTYSQASEELINIRKYRMENKHKNRESLKTKAKSTINLLEKFRKKTEQTPEERINGSKQFSNLSSKIKMLTQSGSVRDFISTTKDIILAKYHLEIKNERLKRVKEVMDNELEAVNDNVESMQKSKKIFINDFKNNFESYIKLLRDKREHEKVILIKLMNIKADKEAKIKIEENKINKIKEERLDKYGDFKNFIYCVKNQTLFEPDEFLQESEALMHFGNYNIEKRLQTIEDPVFLTTKNQTEPNYKMPKITKSFLITSKKSFVMSYPSRQPSIIMDQPEKKYVHELDLPFKDTKEFLTEFGNIENDNVNYVLTYNANLLKIIKLDQEILKFQKQAEKKIQLEQKEYDNLSTSHKDIYLKNEKLKAEKLSIEKSINLTTHQTIKTRNFVSKFSKTYIYKNMLPSKVKLLYDKCRDFILNLDKSEIVVIQKIKSLPNPLECKNTVLEYLRLIEISLDFLNSKYKYLKVTKSIELEDKEDNLVSHRKINKAREQIREKEEKQERNKELIFEKYAKVYPVQKRKVMIKSRPILKKPKAKKKLVNEDKNNIEDLLGIENDSDKEDTVLNTVN